MSVPIERSLLEKLLPAQGVFLDISGAGQTAGIAEIVANLRPRFVLHHAPLAGSLDAYCADRAFRRIHFLNLQATGHELACLRTGISLLSRQRIDVIRFEYGPHFRDAGESLFDLAAFLLPFGYTLIRITGAQIAALPRIPASADTYEPATFLAISSRFSSLLGPAKTEGSLIDVATLFTRYQVAPRGVIHVGAHHAEELSLYKQMGFRHVLFVEANPELAARIGTTIANDPSVRIANFAVSDSDGTATLRITSNDLSSSILRLKLHQTYYPGINETRQVTVPARRLDTLLRELRLSPGDFNYLHLDIQGAELMALRGANELLEHLDALTTEVNFEELYEGCGQFDELDALLTARGFESKVITCPYHPSWGDAFYLRKRAVEAAAASPSRGVLSMSTLGRNGRFGNQLFQYAMLRLLARQHGLTPATSPWIGQKLFGHAEQPAGTMLPGLFEGREIPDAAFPTALMEQSPGSRELWGYFQPDTIHLAPYKDFFRSLFQPVPAIEMPLRQALARLGVPGHPLVALHIRRGDYLTHPANSMFYPAPSAWYRQWLEQLWPTLRDPLLYIATDDPAMVLPDFQDYQPITAVDLGVTMPEAPFYPDFYVMSQADILAISNSSFSFVPAMLNQRATAFYRPHRYRQMLIPFDPWNASPLLHRELGQPIPYPGSPTPTPNPAPAAAPASPLPAGVQFHGKTAGGGHIVSFGKQP